jgi:eukaryotic translation initiation factor 2C
MCYTYVRATLGVSYSSPAYYADRLCDRGRCYLRSFLVAPPGPRKDLENFKRKLLLDKKKKREAKYKPMRKKNDKGYMVRSTEEINQEKEDDNEVEKLCKKDTLDKAKKAFYPDGVEANPWKDSIAGTMFWM